MNPLISLILSIVLLMAARAGDISVQHDFTNGSLSDPQIQKVEAARSLWDFIVIENGMTGAQAVVKVKIQPVRLGSSGPLAVTSTTQYAWNSRGKLVLDGNRSATIKLNMDAGLANWNIHYFACILFHEMGHCLGMDAVTFYYNGFTGGTLLNPDGRYVGPALAVHQFERDPLATFIPVDFGHHAEPAASDWWYNEIMTSGLSYSQYPLTFISMTTVRMIEDNGWTVNPAFQGGLLLDLIPQRRLRDEDSITVN